MPVEIFPEFPIPDHHPHLKPSISIQSRHPSPSVQGSPSPEPLAQATGEQIVDHDPAPHTEAATPSQNSVSDTEKEAERQRREREIFASMARVKQYPMARDENAYAPSITDPDPPDATRRIIKKPPSNGLIAKTILLEGDEDCIGDLLLEWAGLDGAWSENELNNDFSTLHDLLFCCTKLDFTEEEFDADRPMASGNFYTVEIADQAKAKAELEAIVQELIDRKSKNR